LTDGIEMAEEQDKKEIKRLHWSMGFYIGIKISQNIFKRGSNYLLCPIFYEI